MRRICGPLVRVLAIAYPVVLAFIAALLRFIGEHWWVTAIGLYLPRAVFALPLPCILGALVYEQRRRLYWTQLAAVVVLAFPLMGLTLHFWSSGQAAPTLRVLSLNANSGISGANTILGAIDRYAPDVVLMQEIDVRPGRPLFIGLEARYPSVSTSTQFVVASRFPLSAGEVPPGISYLGKGQEARFLRYLIQTPFGPVALYNVHPNSPREGFYRVRGKGLRREILSGRFFAGVGGPAVQANSDVRALQVETVESRAAKEQLPVIIVGDTNLPSLSPVLAPLERAYQDGFQEAGWGFGYTFPSELPWMRIDRMLASAQFSFRHFEVGCKGASDHLCIVADLTLRPQ